MFLNVNSTNQLAATDNTVTCLAPLRTSTGQRASANTTPKTQVHTADMSTSVPLYSQRTLALFSLLACFGPFQGTLRRMPPFITQARRMEHFVSQLSCQHVPWNLQTSTVMLTEGWRATCGLLYPWCIVMAWRKPLGNTNDAPNYIKC